MDQIYRIYVCIQLQKCGKYNPKCVNTTLLEHYRGMFTFQTNVRLSDNRLSVPSTPHIKIQKTPKITSTHSSVTP